MAKFICIKDVFVFRTRAPISGKEYEFNKGLPTEVSPEDIPYFRKHNLTYSEVGKEEKKEKKVEKIVEKKEEKTGVE
mgnify:CR=1 FL=1